MPIAAVGGAILGGVLQGNAASDAANTQANAARDAGALQYQSGQQALDFQKQVYGNTQAQAAPYLQAGYGGLANLESLLGISSQGNMPSLGAASQGGGLGSSALSPQQLNAAVSKLNTPVQGVGPRALADYVNNQRTALGSLTGDPRYSTGAINGGKVSINGVGAQTSVPAGAPGTTSLASLVNPNLGGFGSLMQPYGEKFVAPTGATEQNDPGYQFRLNEGEKALQNSAAAKGTLLSGATGADIQKYGQDYASNEYGDVYNRALGEYQNRYNIFQNDQTNKYNRLASLAGIGQTAGAQLNSAGQYAAGNVGNILQTQGAQVGNSINNAAYQRASGYGAYNPLASSFGSLGSLLGKAYDQGGDVGDWSGLWNGTGH